MKEIRLLRNIVWNKSSHKEYISKIVGYLCWLLMMEYLIRIILERRFLRISWCLINDDHSIDPNWIFPDVEILMDELRTPG